MIISAELSEALAKLKHSNTLSTVWDIEDVLGYAGGDEDICKFISKHARGASLYDELISLIENKTFPKDPRINIPFAFTLLYFFDINKLVPEDILVKMYPDSDIDRSHSFFFGALVDSLVDSLNKADPEMHILVSEKLDNNEIDQKFEELDNAINDAFEDELKGKLTLLTANLKKEALNGNFAFAKEIFKVLEDTFKNNNANLTLLDGTKDVLREIGVEL